MAGLFNKPSGLKRSLVAERNTLFQRELDEADDVGGGSGTKDANRLPKRHLPPVTNTADSSDDDGPDLAYPGSDEESDDETTSVDRKRVRLSKDSGGASDNDESSNAHVGFSTGDADNDEDEDWDKALEEQKSSERLSTTTTASTSSQSVDTSRYGSFAEQMMSKMGYDPSKGLGAKGQGRVEPVGMSTQRGREGFGMRYVSDLKPDLEAKWDESQEKLVVEETPSWMSSCTDEPPTYAELRNWMKKGQKKMEIDDETEFCSEEILSGMLKAKNVFDELSQRELHNARTRANPFETIKGVIFQNRAAMKMANLDAVLDFALTDPKIENPSHHTDEIQHATSLAPKDLTHPHLFYFADICAGPGGFSEYVLWRRGFHCHGFGFTLKGNNDFLLDKFLSACPEFFEPYYGSANDGNIMNPQNLVDFKTVVLNGTHQQGVHLVMADGGFSVEGQENLQEILSKRLYLCQFACALDVLRPGGNFICKLFDVFTPFSVGLVYLMYRVFHRVCIHKPHTSRPANSERYIICMNLRSRESVTAVVNYLHTINRQLDTFQREKPANQQSDVPESDITDVVPIEMLKADGPFYEYIRRSNENLARRQTVYLDKYRVFAKNIGLMDLNQENLRSNCLKYWKVPDEKRPENFRSGPNMAFPILTGLNSPLDMIPIRASKYPSGIEADLTGDVHQGNIVGLDYRAVTLSTAEGAQLFIGLGGSCSYRASFSPAGIQWDNMSNLRLPRRTVVYAEYAQLTKIDKKDKSSRYVLRVIDAFLLAGDAVHHLPFYLRQTAIHKFCAALNRDHNPIKLPNYVSIIPAEPFRLCNLKDFMQRLSLVNDRGALTIQLAAKKPDSDKKFAGLKPEALSCRNLLLLRPTNPGWACRWSRTHSAVFLFKQESKDNDKHFEREDHTKKGQLELSKRGCADFCATMRSQINWQWRDVDGAKVQRLFKGDDTDELDLTTLPGLAKRVEKQLEAVECNAPPNDDHVIMQH